MKLKKLLAGTTACSWSKAGTAPNIGRSGNVCALAVSMPASTSASAKVGREVWIQASYNPVIGADSKATKVAKFASDITAAKLAWADTCGQLDAIGKSQAVIEFSVTGEILTANANFCAAIGYGSRRSKDNVTACL